MKNSFFLNRLFKGGKRKYELRDKIRDILWLIISSLFHIALIIKKEKNACEFN